MSINARVQITSDLSHLTWNSSSTRWDGVVIRIYYPTAGVGQSQQTYSSNPPSNGDFIVDEAGKIWKIENVDTSYTVKPTNFHFRVSISVQNRDKIEDVEPECGNTNFGAICTAVNGALNPLSDTTFVTSSVNRVAMNYNISSSAFSGTGGSASLDGSTKITGTIIPDTAELYNLGSADNPFSAIYTNDLFIGAHSLYVNDKKVVEDNSDTITISTDANQDLLIKTTGTGDININSENTVSSLSFAGMSFTVPTNLNNKQFTISNQSLGGNISLSATGTGSQVQLSGNDEVDLTAPSLDFNGNVDISNNLVVHGDMTIIGSSTNIETTNMAVTDNEIVLNSGLTGTSGIGGGTGISGLRINRGDLADALIYFDENDDKFKCGLQGGIIKTIAEGEANQNALYSIAVSGQNTITSDNTQQAISFIAGNNVSLSTDNTNKTITISATVANIQSLHTVSTSTYTVTGSDIIICTLEGNQTIILPQPSSGCKVDIKKISSTGTITVQTPGTETIDGSTADKLVTTQYENITLVCNGVNWFIL